MEIRPTLRNVAHLIPARPAVPRIADQALDTFRAYDTNRDGFLGYDEYQNFARLLSGGVQSRSEAYAEADTFDRYDRNKDRQLSLAEFTLMFRDLISRNRSVTVG